MTGNLITPSALLVSLQGPTNGVTCTTVGGSQSQGSDESPYGVHEVRDLLPAAHVKKGQFLREEMATGIDGQNGVVKNET